MVLPSFQSGPIGLCIHSTPISLSSSCLQNQTFETACVLWYCIYLQMNAGIWLDRDNTIQEVMEKYSHMDTSGNELRQSYHFYQVCCNVPTCPNLSCCSINTMTNVCHASLEGYTALAMPLKIDPGRSTSVVDCLSVHPV